MFLGLIALALVVACGGADSGPSDQLGAGRSVYGSACSMCHGEVGQGGVGPALEGVVETFPACTDHLRWVTLGSNGWREQVGDRFGATNQPVQGGMPSHEASLTAAEIQSVVVYERVRFADEELETATAECGRS